MKGIPAVMKEPAASTTGSCFHQMPQKSKSYASRKGSHSNVFQLLAQREISPQGKHVPRSMWGESNKHRRESDGLDYKEIDARCALTSWVEAESLRHLSPKYCPLLPPPRSTIAAAFSSDGRTLASTHGDHTVKIIDCLTGNCLKVLSGHRRTPWVVRYHPIYPEILASGSLDHEVRLWDANTADCIGSKDFHRPIASIAFHAQGELLAVASGHKLYIWNYSKREASSPTIVLKTRRSLRAVHFHPHAAPFLLTAEVNDLDSPDTPLTPATTSGYLRYPPPVMFFRNAHLIGHPRAELGKPISLGPLFPIEDGRLSLRHEIGTLISSNRRAESSFSDQSPTNSYIVSHNDVEITAMDMYPSGTSNAGPLLEDETANTSPADMEIVNSDSHMDTMESSEMQANNNLQSSFSLFATNSSSPSLQQNEAALQLPVRQFRFRHGSLSGSYPSDSLRTTDNQFYLRSVDNGQLHQFIPSVDSPCWELPFLQGWLMGQTHAGLHAVFPSNNSLLENSSIVQGISSDALISDLLPARGMESIMNPSDAANTRGQSRGHTRSGIHHSRHALIASGGEGIPHLNVEGEGGVHRSTGFNMEPEISNTVSADSSTDLPCTVKLIIWPYDMQKPSKPLDGCHLAIPHAVLCSEMGAHFSPCGRFLAVCVACVLPHMELDPGLHSQSHHDVTEAGTSPTRHPISGHRIIYELRVYSLEEATFGLILASRTIRAAHCLTSIQFSPTSEHILVAYGRRHTSLLRSFVSDGEAKLHIYTILEVYRVSDMELVRVLPSADDEVNVASFHPFAGCGLVYGTKEGKLRILQFDHRNEMNCSGKIPLLDEEVLEN